MRKRVTGVGGFNFSHIVEQPLNFRTVLWVIVLQAKFLGNFQVMLQLDMT